MMQFESGAVRQFPLDKLYFKSTPDGARDILQVTFTRRHSNTNLSFAVFYINSLFGDILAVDYNYDIPEKSFIPLFTEFTQEDTTKIPSYHQLISDGIIAMMALDEKVPEDYFYAKNILPTETELASIATKAVTMAHFQQHHWPAPDPELLFDFVMMEQMRSLDLQMVGYDPKIYAAWTAKQWEAFFLEDLLPMDLKTQFNEKLLGCLYFYDKILAKQASISPKTGEALKRLSRSNPRFTDNLEVPGYTPSPKEKIYQSVIKELMPYQEFKEKEPRESRLLVNLHTEYPKNPYFMYLISYGKALWGNLDEARQLSIHFYNKFPNSQLTIAGIIETHFQKSSVPINVFSKALLLEDHIGPVTPVCEADFHNYYLSLGAYLQFTKQLPAIWKLYKIMRRYPLFNQSLILQQKWQQLLIQIVSEVFEYYLSASNNDQKKILRELMAKK